MLLDDLVVIVTGVGPGLGRCIARACSAHGASVVLAARTPDRLEKIAAELAGPSLAVPTDVADAGACAGLVDATVARFGRLDGLVNSAFKQPPLETIDETSMDTWREAFEMNCHVAIQMTKAALPAMRASGGGSVVMITTMSTRNHRPRFGAYAAAKSALASAARTLATELGSDGIRVNSVAPGYIWGEPVRFYLEWQAKERGITYADVERELLAEMPLGRIPTPEEIAETVVFYLSGMSSIVTGTMLDVNAGQFMPA
jgi:NAD(P)-dependent dehydrogenase (short-subunit alcohol dehydrogenase family)